MSEKASDHFDLAFQHFREGQYTEALAAFKSGLALDSNNWTARLYSGMCHARLGDLAAAKREFLNIRDLCPDNDMRAKAASALSALTPAMSQQSIKKLGSNN